MTPRDDMKISGLTAADVAQIAEIEKLCFTDPWSEKSIEEELSNPLARYFVLREGEAVTGYVGTRVIDDVCEITNVAVRPDKRRQGFADTLLNALLEGLRGVKYVNLEVRESNAPARALYEKHGFKICGRRRNYYEKPREDAILYTLCTEDK
ncbi:MAG: ribosomal protein S18-alanine N-acetyltransferase [Clostridia bacterium]|nr:ribosomal protein S18-alanine N-acetyltransferase [Clostridia bacterium]